MPPLLAALSQEERLFSILLQLVVILGVARLFGMGFKKIGQAVVVGEIAAGIVLGPSVFGKLEVALGYTQHELSRTVFNPEVAPVLLIIKELGLILLLFLVGLDFELGQLRKSPRTATAIAVVGVAAPFILGWGLAQGILPHLENVEVRPGVFAPVNARGFALYLGTAVAITALPVLGRMVWELGIQRTRLAAISLAAAAANDAVGWVLLATVTAMVSPATADQNHALHTLAMVGLIVAFGAALVLVRPVLIRWANRLLERHDGRLGHGGLLMMLILMLLAAMATSWIGIFAIFGAFAFGVSLSDQHALREAIRRDLEPLVMALFVPIFFAYTGLRTDIGSLSGGTLWVICGLVSAVAIGGKLGGCSLAAKLSGMTTRESLCVGAMMNTRALMELIVINVGYDLKVIPRSVFCMLVIMALLTTVMTFPLLRWFRKGTEIDPAMRVIVAT